MFFFEIRILHVFEADLEHFSRPERPQTQRSSYFCLPSAGIKCRYHHVWLYFINTMKNSSQGGGLGSSRWISEFNASLVYILSSKTLRTTKSLVLYTIAEKKYDHNYHYGVFISSPCFLLRCAPYLLHLAPSSP